MSGWEGGEEMGTLGLYNSHIRARFNTKFGTQSG